MSVHAPAEHVTDLSGFELGRSAPAPAPAPGRVGQRVAFYLGMPLLLATPLGWYGAGIASQASRPVGLLLWALIVCLSWWCSDLCTRLLAFVTGSRHPRSAWLLVGGFFVNVVLARYHSPAAVAACLHLGLVGPTPMVARFMSAPRDLLDLHYLASLVTTGVPGLVFWLAGNFALERYRESGAATIVGQLPQPDAQPPAPSVATTTSVSYSPAADAPGSHPAPRATLHEPRFFHRLSRLAGLGIDELVAVEAEDHYIQVHSTRGKELVYYRFRDALQELQAVPGLQIHRSAWVSRQHVAALDGRGRKLGVVLVTGDRLAVSLSNRGALLQAGLQHAPAH